LYLELSIGESIMNDKMKPIDLPYHSYRHVATAGVCLGLTEAWRARCAPKKLSNFIVEKLRKAV
jgi:hypothetical protein